MNQLKIINDDILHEFRIYKAKLGVVSNLNHGMHGKEHLLRVVLFTLLICEKLNVCHKYREIVAVAALYHDIGRKSDNIDIVHGLLSWKRAKKYLDKDFTDNDLKIIKYIIENHCVPDEEAHNNVNFYNIYNKEVAQRLLDIVKDADSLDIIRLEYFNESFLRLEVSKKIISFAYYINELKEKINYL